MYKKAIVAITVFSVIIIALGFLALTQEKSYAKIKPLFSPQEVQKMEGSIEKALAETSSIAFGSQIRVHDCTIINRVESAQNCSDPYSLRMQEFRLDLRETNSVTQSSLDSSKYASKSLLKFHFQPEIEEKMKNAKKEIWDFVSEKHGLRGVIWGEFAESAEQRLVKQYGFDKLGSYDITQTCSSEKKMRHLPEKVGTYILNGDTRKLSRTIRSYHQYCVASDS
nr:hypothetical protein [uncultured Cohaesibacter sp.]